jgi:hypothetical protein
MRMLSGVMVAGAVLGAIASAGATGANAQGVYLQGPGFGVEIGRPAYSDRYYRSYHDYDSARFYSERRYQRGPYAYERRWRGRDWD